MLAALPGMAARKQSSARQQEHPKSVQAEFVCQPVPTVRVLTAGVFPAQNEFHRPVTLPSRVEQRNRWRVGSHRLFPGRVSARAASGFQPQDQGAPPTRWAKGEEFSFMNWKLLGLIRFLSSSRHKFHPESR